MRNTFTVGLTTALAVLGAAVPTVAHADSAAAGAPRWSTPTCRTVTGDGSVTFSRDEGRSIVPTSKVLTPVVYTSGLVTLDRPGTLLSLSNNLLASSRDAGCTWTPVGKVAGWYLRLVAAPGGRAYAWDQDGNLSLATPAGVTPLTSPAGTVTGLGVDQRDGDHLRVSDGDGQLHDSRDGGRTWRPVGRAAGSLTAFYTAAFDPANLDHVVLGGMSIGAHVTVDGGRTWTASTGLSRPGGAVNAFSVAVSPAKPNVVYAMALDQAELDAGAPSGGRHIYRSTDGGRRFNPVVDQDSKVTIPNGPLLVAHPTDPDVVYFVFGTSFMAYGTDIHRYDSRSRRVSTVHNAYDRVTAMAFHPRSPRLLYLGVAEEG
ncbi:hypothetical protein GCM10022225_12830 [Plantactinospora mayteni]|uniref:Dispase autolysis-inducing protein n=1 Tax=Plantactinospora mayteni TaxID=566021 RepID=A0ABQ4EH36_9ACTN|nr:hypothetical protein [Plantactinospora mayteni]GIG93964.1 hypothetical protein Pma05_05370 [Plantactinospora mayteni]